MNRWVISRKLSSAAFVMLLLSGCQTYNPKSLPTSTDLLQSPVLSVPVSRFHLPGLKPHPFPARGLDETAVVTLAVFNNPDLKAARLQAGVARAQLLEAGLLPDPVLSGGLAKSAMYTGFNVGLSEDIKALITRGAASAAARAHARQVNLEILWREYQVAEKAAELFIQSRADNELKDVLGNIHGLLARRYHQDEDAFKLGNMTAVTVSNDLAALLKAESNLRQLQLDASRRRHELNRLLGLEPDVRLHLIGGNESRSISDKQFQEAIESLPHRRADLLALQAGYESQEQLLREAILAQFPSLSAVVDRSRSPEEGVYSSGFTVNITLPLFNRNRGQIAVQKATRARLHQTYQARLDQAVSEADQVRQATHIMARQLRDVESRLFALKETAAAGERSYRQGNMDPVVYVDLQSSFLNAQASAIRLRASLAVARSALDVLLGRPLLYR